MEVVLKVFVQRTLIVYQVWLRGRLQIHPPGKKYTQESRHADLSKQLRALTYLKTK